MKKWKNQLTCLGCALALTACGSSNNSSSPAASSSDQSIAGPDTDNNGVRDDVDAYINTQYLVASQRNAALQMARVIQRELLVSKTDKAAIKLVLLAQSRAISCVYLKFDSNSPIKPAAVVGDIESVTTNTRKRLLAYLAFSKAADGTTGRIPKGDTCE